MTRAIPTDAEPAESSPERSRFFGRTKGKKIRQEQARVMAGQLPSLLVPLGADTLDLAGLFAFKASGYRLEIGFGGGEHLLKRALENPDIGFVGCEPFVNGMAKLVMEIDRLDVRNIRVYDNDATRLLRKLPEGSLDAIDLLYPDPWPKRRQRKRRFVSPETLSLFAKSLKSGGEFRFASDIDDYVGWTLSRVMASGDWHWPAMGPAEWLVPYPGWVRTRYETKAVHQGRTTSYLTFIRR